MKAQICGGQQSVTMGVCCHWSMYSLSPFCYINPALQHERTDSNIDSGVYRLRCLATVAWGEANACLTLTPPQQLWCIATVIVMFNCNSPRISEKNSSIDKRPYQMHLIRMGGVSERESAMPILSIYYGHADGIFSYISYVGLLFLCRIWFEGKKDYIELVLRNDHCPQIGMYRVSYVGIHHKEYCWT